MVRRSADRDATGQDFAVALEAISGLRLPACSALHRDRFAGLRSKSVAERVSEGWCGRGDSNAVNLTICSKSEEIESPELPEALKTRGAGTKQVHHRPPERTH
jgi:hypothetical protein